MTLPRTVAEVLSDHVAFEVECIDRMYLLSELGRVSSQFTRQGGMRTDIFAFHDRDRTGRATGSHCVDRCAGGFGPAGG